MKTSKAELFSPDFIVGLSLFLIAMTIFGLYYTAIQSDVGGYKTRNEMQNKANNIANLLVTSSGEPKYWNYTNVRVIGLYDSGLINLTKFEELNKTEYYTTKKMLGVGGYELYIELRNETNHLLKNDSLSYVFGKKKDKDVLQVSYVERYGLTNLNGNITKTIIGVVIWL